MSFIKKRIQFMRPRQNGREPSSWPTDGCGMPLRITRMFPMKLKDVSLEKLKEERVVQEVICVNEMMTLFDCFEKSDYNASVCQQQADKLEQCYSTHMAKKYEKKLQRTIEREKAKNK